MTDQPVSSTANTDASLVSSERKGLLRSLISLARPSQWSKSAFVIIGPLYHAAEGNALTRADIRSVLAAAVAFALASSFCYIVNDYRDRESDRHHPRKRHRPLASGAVTPTQAGWFAAVLLAVAVALVFVIGGTARLWVFAGLGAYVVNVVTYSLFMKKAVILDVISLASGFVIRALAGCAAMAIEPSTWLLNCTFFLAMFLAFGKRLGERRTLGVDAEAARGVQRKYTDDMLRMAVVVTGVITLLTYASYTQTREDLYMRGFNLLWLTILPATYGVLRCLVLLERGAYDDPTLLATRDRPFQAAAALFVGITIVLVSIFRAGSGS